MHGKKSLIVAIYRSSPQRFVLLFSLFFLIFSSKNENLLGCDATRFGDVVSRRTQRLSNCQVSDRFNEQKNEQSNKGTMEQTNEQTNEQTIERTIERLNEETSE